MRKFFLFVLLGLWYSLTTLPYITNFPIQDWPQMGIVAPAYKLATQGIYGNDLFTGFYHTEIYNYEYMPLYPLLIALSLKLLGLGIWQVRLVSIICGWFIILLTFRLGQHLYNTTVGGMAAVILSCVQFGLDYPNFGIPLLDWARFIRYDIIVPIGVLTSCLLFHKAKTPRHYIWAGIWVGLATLGHLYGAFILGVFALVLWWEQSVLAYKPYLFILLGWLVIMSMWVVYIGQDFAAYQGQMLRHEGRFDLTSLHFYWTNLSHEPSRYSIWLRQLRQQPRFGIWLLLTTIPFTMLQLCREVYHHKRRGDSLLLLSLPTLVLMLALFMNLKRYPYLILILPFIALQIAYALDRLWHYKKVRGLIQLSLILVMLESSHAVYNTLQAASQATSYTALTQQLAQPLPPHSRLLIPQPYWLGLANYETRSLNLPYVLTLPQYHFNYTMTAAINSINPDYIIMEDTILTPAYQQSNPIASEQWQKIGEYIKRHCPKVIQTINTPDYGPITTYQCQRLRQ